MNTTYDEKEDALYIYLKGPVPGQVKTLSVSENPLILLDVSAEGELIGLEVIGFKEFLRTNSK